MKIQNITLLNTKSKKVSFGRTTEEHKSWSQRIDPKTKEVNFKLLTFPDVKSVSALVFSESGNKEIELKNLGDGVFQKTNIPQEIVKNGDKYQFKITKNDGSEEIVKDPYSPRQETLNGPSTIYDHSLFEWQNDEEWSKNPDRITKDNVRSARIYAISPDTITDSRSYEGIISKLKNIKKYGFNSIEIMHAENTFKYNWGYDGVDKHAPSEFLGGPDSLKKLVDAAHKEGLNVILDVVPNHMGPDGNQLARTGPYIKCPNDFGDAINYEGENSEYVRDWMINAMLGWVENYHVDGLRLDMTKYMESDYTLKQLAAEMNYHHPDCFLIAEDSRSGISVDYKGNYWENSDEIHDKRVTSILMDEEYGKGESQEIHANAIKNIVNNSTNLARLGMNSEWDFNFYHTLDSAFYSPNPDTDAIVRAALCSQEGVKYVMSHDEIGNHEGTRKIPKTMAAKLLLNDYIDINESDIKRAKDLRIHTENNAKNKCRTKLEYYGKSEQKIQDELSKINISYEDMLFTVRCQKAQLAAEKLAVMLQTGELDCYKITPEMSPRQSREIRKRLHSEVLEPLGISASSGITYKSIKAAYEKSLAQFRMATAFTYGVPGAKMTFQGDEKADLTPFRFFREFESIPYENYLFTEKGYLPGDPALEESTMGKIKYSRNGLRQTRDFSALIQDVNKLNAENSALSEGFILENNTMNWKPSGVIGLHSFNEKDGNEIYMITNFCETSYRRDKENRYGAVFPKGQWIEVLNTDDMKYGGTSRHLNKNRIIKGDGETKHPVNIDGYSTIYFKRVG